MSGGRTPPDVCSGCSDEEWYKPRYMTGGGGRVSHYRYETCGREFRPWRDPQY